MKTFAKKLESLLELGGMKKDVLFLCISGVALVVSLFDLAQLPFDAAWVAIVLCGYSYSYNNIVYSFHFS